MKLLCLLFLGLSGCATSLLSNNENIWITYNNHKPFYCVANLHEQGKPKPICYEAGILEVYDYARFKTEKNAPLP